MSRNRGGGASRRSGDMASGISCLRMEGLPVPDHTTLSRRARTWKPSARGNDRQHVADGPVHVLVDSTGLKIYGAGKWLEEKHGAKSRRGWRKLHREWEKGGVQAARANLPCLSRPSATAARTFNTRWAPTGDQRICRFLFIRAFTRLLAALSAGELDIG